MHRIEATVAACVLFQLYGVFVDSNRRIRGCSALTIFRRVHRECVSLPFVSSATAGLQRRESNSSKVRRLDPIDRPQCDLKPKTTMETEMESAVEGSKPTMVQTPDGKLRQGTSHLIVTRCLCNHIGRRYLGQPLRANEANLSISAIHIFTE